MSQLVLIYLVIGEVIILRALHGILKSGERPEGTLWAGCLVTALAVLGWPVLLAYAGSISREK